jgi:hypothetical protein
MYAKTSLSLSFLAGVAMDIWLSRKVVLVLWPVLWILRMVFVLVRRMIAYKCISHSSKKHPETLCRLDFLKTI